MNLDKLHEHVISLRVPANNHEVARLVYIAGDQSIGIQFQIEIINTDAIQLFSVCQEHHREIKLLHSFYQNAQGELFDGIDAQEMMEHDKENRMIQVLASRDKAQQEEAFQLRQLEKKGKITFH
jgi:hypothetical protein